MRSKILNRRQISRRPSTPTGDGIDLAIPTRTSGFRDLLDTAVLIDSILGRMRVPFMLLGGLGAPVGFTDYKSRDALRVAVLPHGLISGSMGGFARKDSMF